MKTIEEKIKSAVDSGRLNLNKFGWRKWHKYYINTMELVWARNMHDGYQIDVYDGRTENHLAKIII